MMRTPTPLYEQLAWHHEELNRRSDPLNRALYEENVRQGIKDGVIKPIADGDVRCGWFKVKVVKNGPWVPARIWLEQDIDLETGELMSDEVFHCEVGGKTVDPQEWFLWLQANPIAEAEFNERTAHRNYVIGTGDAGDPYYNPRKPLDFFTLPFPEFDK